MAQFHLSVNKKITNMGDDGTTAFVIITNLIFLIWLISKISSKVQNSSERNDRFSSFISAVKNIGANRTYLTDTYVNYSKPIYHYYPTGAGGRNLKIGTMDYSFGIDWVNPNPYWPREVREIVFSFSVTAIFNKVKNGRIVSYRKYLYNKSKSMTELNGKENSLYYQISWAPIYFSVNDCTRIIEEMTKNVINSQEYKDAIEFNSPLI